MRLTFVKILPLLILLLITVFTKSSYKITVNNTAIEVEIADTPSERERGLMYRASLKDEHGMLFIYPAPQILSFLMKNTLIPLSIAFIDTKGRIISIQEMVPQASPPFTYYVSPGPAKYALEVPQGWFSMGKVSVGDMVKFPQSLEKAVKNVE